MPEGAIYMARAEFPAGFPDEVFQEINRITRGAVDPCKWFGFSIDPTTNSTIVLLRLETPAPEILVEDIWSLIRTYLPDQIRKRMGEGTAISGGIIQRLVDIDFAYDSIVISALGFSNSPISGKIGENVGDSRINVEKPQSVDEYLDEIRVVARSSDDLASIVDLPHDLSLGLAEERQAQEGRNLQILGAIAFRTSQASRIKDEVAGLVEAARLTGSSWSQIAKAAGITPQAAHRRWDPDARKKHSDYQRNSSRSRRSSGANSQDSDSETFPT